MDVEAPGNGSHYLYGDGCTAQLTSSVQVDAVVRECSVRDARGCLVTTAPAVYLQATDGSVTPCTVRRLGTALRMVPVRDASFSLDGIRDATIRRAFDLVLKGLARLGVGSEVAVLEFADQPRWLTEGFVTADEAVATVRWQPADGGTDLWAGVSAALDRIESEPSPLPTVLVLATDGADRGTRDAAVFAAVQERVRRLRLPVYVLGFPAKRLQGGRLADTDSDGHELCVAPDWQPGRGEGDRLQQLAATAGGAAFFPKRAAAIADVVRFMLAEALGRYHIEADVEDGKDYVQMVAQQGVTLRCDAP